MAKSLAASDITIARNSVSIVPFNDHSDDWDVDDDDADDADYD
jgi:hypothetical protein